MTACTALGPATLVHYAVTRGGFASVPATDGAIDAVTLSGLSPAGCDGQTVRLVMTGNAAANASMPANLVLSTPDSALEPCSQKALALPVTISGGSITLPLCAAGGSAGYVDVRMLTRLALTVGGVPVPVASPGTPSTTAPTTTSTTAPTTSTTPTGSPPGPPPTTTGASGGVAAGSTATRPTAPAPAVLGETLRPGSNRSAPGPGILAFTGADAARTTAVGLAAISIGLLLRRLRGAPRD